jgi:hypothetical protein
MRNIYTIYKQYINTLYDENLVKMVHLAVRVECIIYRGCVMVINSVL